MAEADKTTTKQWHDGIDATFFETKTGSLNWYSFTEIFVSLFSQDCKGLIAERLIEKGFVFARTQCVKINPKVYEYMTRPNVQIHHTIDTTHCGQSSYSAIQLIADNRGNILATNDFRLVYVDKNTRQSIPLPEYFRNAVAQSHHGSYNQLKKFDLKEYVCQPGYFKMDFTVVYTDLDSNGHATQTSYIRHVFNTLVAAVESRALDNISINDVLSAQEIRFSNEAESNLGTRLTVKVWNDKSSGLHAHIVEDMNPEKILLRAFIALGNKEAKL